MESQLKSYGMLKKKKRKKKDTSQDLKSRYKTTLADPQRETPLTLCVGGDGGVSKLAHSPQEFTPLTLCDGCNAFVLSVLVGAHTGT